jgi:hypothetical protein
MGFAERGLCDFRAPRPAAKPAVALIPVRRHAVFVDVLAMVLAMLRDATLTLHALGAEFAFDVIGAVLAQAVGTEDTARFAPFVEHVLVSSGATRAYVAA